MRFNIPSNGRLAILSEAKAGSSKGSSKGDGKGFRIERKMLQKFYECAYCSIESSDV